MDVLRDAAVPGFEKDYEVGSVVIGLGKAAMLAGKTTAVATFIEPAKDLSERAGCRPRALLADAAPLRSGLTASRQPPAASAGPWPPLPWTPGS